jgi:hypothetical protein
MKNQKTYSSRNMDIKNCLCYCSCAKKNALLSPVMMLTLKTCILPMAIMSRIRRMKKLISLKCGVPKSDEEYNQQNKQIIAFD